MYGLTNTSDPFRFVKLSGHAQILRIRDPVIPIETALSKPLPSPPWEAGLRFHWLAIDGKQPSIPENVPMLRPKRRPKRRKMDILSPEPEVDLNAAADMKQKKSSADGQDALQQTPGGVLVKAPLKHVLSKELNMYLNKVMSVLEGTAPHAEDRTRPLESILTSLKLDAGLQPLAPYLCHMFAEQIWNQCGIQNSSRQGGSERYVPSKLNAFLRAAECIASNRTLDLSWYLHELMPAVADAVLDVPHVHIDKNMKQEERLRQINRKYRWDQREFAAKAIATICMWYPEVAPRIQKQYVQGLKSPPESRIPTIYGSVVGLTYQGSRAVQTLLLPNIVPLVRNLIGHGKSCNARELDIIRDALVSAASAFLCRFPIQKLPQSSLPGSWEILAPEAYEGTTTRSSKQRKSSKEEVSDIFNADDDLDPCIIFSQSPSSIKSSQKWLSEYCARNSMHDVTGKNQDNVRYHPLAVHKTADGRIDVVHQTSFHKYVPQAEVFPPQKVTNDAKAMQRTYAEDPSPDEYLRLMHGIFGIQSEPIILRGSHLDEVFL